MRLRVGCLTAGNQSFGRHTTIVQAIAAHLVAFQKHHISAHLGGTGRHRQSARSGSDDQDIRLNAFHDALLRLFAPKRLDHNRQRRKQA